MLNCGDFEMPCRSWRGRDRHSPLPLWFMPVTAIPGDMIWHQLVGVLKSHTFLQFAVTVECHAPPQTWQAAYKPLPSLMPIRADWCYRRMLQKQKMRLATNTLLESITFPDVWTGWNNHEILKWSLSQSTNSQGACQYPTYLRRFFGLERSETLSRRFPRLNSLL